MKKEKYKLLRKSLLYDVVGMATLAIPVIGPFLDMLWAPIAARKMIQLYPGKKGKIMGAVTFLEEILPFSDAVPTFTLMWLYTFIWKSQNKPSGITVEAEVVS